MRLIELTIRTTEFLIRIPEELYGSDGEAIRMYIRNVRKIELSAEEDANVTTYSDERSYRHYRVTVDPASDV